MQKCSLPILIVNSGQVLDELEDRVLRAMQKLGSYLMEKKIEDWNIQLYYNKQETCEKCGSKLKHKQEERQIATWVSDVTIKRYKRYCPECKETEYPLDHVLGLQPRQRYSNSVEELTVLCGASWDYGKSEYIMKKVLRRPCISHETIFNKTNELGEAISKELEGSKRKLYHLKKLSAYIERNRDGVWYREAKEEGISIGSGSADKAGDILICRRMKLRGMSWCREKADNVLNIRILVLNGEWDEFWKKLKAA